jgi:HPt (histidine-containing phosphotransfer) domain-containing protein
MSMPVAASPTHSKLAEVTLMEPLPITDSSCALPNPVYDEVATGGTGMSELDLERALERVGGDEALLSELAQLFLEECPRLFGEIQAGVTGGDAAGVSAAAHQLKGLLGQFGAETAKAQAMSVEMSAREGDLTPVGEMIQALGSLLQKMEPELRRLAQGPSSA